MTNVIIMLRFIGMFILIIGVPFNLLGFIFFPKTIEIFGEWCLYGCRYENTELCKIFKEEHK